MRNAREILEQTLAKDARFILLFLFLNNFAMAWFHANRREYWQILLYVPTTLFIVVFLTALGRKFLNERQMFRAKRTLVFISCIPFVAEVFVMHTYKALIGPGIADAILHTNYREAVEFLSSHVDIGFILFLVVAAFFVYRIRDRIAIPKSACRVLIVAGFCSASITAMTYASMISTDISKTLNLITIFLNETSAPSRLFSATAIAVGNSVMYNQFLNEVEGGDIEITENNGNTPNIVLILGESTNRNYMSLYGYGLPTSPWLEKRDNLVVFTDTISPHTTTVEVMREMFTFCDYESTEPWYKYHNLIDVMNAAGYRTVWISNQESSSLFGNLGQFFGQRSDESVFVRKVDIAEDDNIFDEDILPVVDEKIMDAGKNFYVIHLFGTHDAYKNRYPKEFDVFSADDIKNEKPKEQRQTIAEYANAVRHNDFIINEIIKKFEGKDAIILFVSDHGESVYDEGDFAGHIMEAPSRPMVEVPMIIWGSESYIKNNPEKWERIKAAKEKPYRTDDLIHTITDIANIKTSEWDYRKSIVDKNFDTYRPRYYGGKDYDTEKERK